VAAEVGSGTGEYRKSSTITVVLAWTVVGILLAWGVYMTLLSVAKFFN
jgi:hypothetical protein